MAAAASRGSSTSFSFSLWEGKVHVVQHYTLMSESLSPPNVQTRANMAKTAQSIDYIQDVFHPARSPHLNNIFFLNLACSARCHPPQSFTQKHISSHRGCTQPMGRSEIVQNQQITTHNLYIQYIQHRVSSIWSEPLTFL